MLVRNSSKGLQDTHSRPDAFENKERDAEKRVRWIRDGTNDAGYSKSNVDRDVRWHCKKELVNSWGRVEHPITRGRLVITRKCHRFHSSRRGRDAELDCGKLPSHYDRDRACVGGDKGDKGVLCEK